MQNGLTMRPPRNILLPVDFSEPSGELLEYAAALAARLEANLDVLHVWEPPVPLPPLGVADSAAVDPALPELVKQDAQQGIEQFVAQARQRGINLRAARLESGPPAQTIVEIAKTGGYDLIVIGTHGRTGIVHALLGSVAERVVRHAPCPVLSVRLAVPATTHA
jgi:nucleotide-binding universal stress UspA family protein